MTFPDLRSQLFFWQWEDTTLKIHVFISVLSVEPLVPSYVLSRYSLHLFLFGSIYIFVFSFIRGILDII